MYREPGAVCGDTKTVLLEEDVRGGCGLGGIGQWYEWESVCSKEIVNFIFRDFFLKNNVFSVKF